MNRAVDASFQSAAELGIATRLFPVHAALRQDEFGDCAHPGLTNANWAHSRLLIERHESSLAHCLVSGPGRRGVREPEGPCGEFVAELRRCPPVTEEHVLEGLGGQPAAAGAAA